MLDRLKLTVKDSFIYSLGNISTKVIGLILLPLYLKELSVAEYGMLGILEVSLQVLVALFGLSLYQAFYRWYWDKAYRDKQNSLFFTTLAFVTLSAFVMALIFSSISPTLSSMLLDSADYAYLLRLMLISAALQIITRVPMFLMRLQRKAIRFATTNFLKLLITLLLTIYFIVHQNKKLDGIFEAQIIGFVFFLVINIKYIIENIQLKFELPVLKEMLSYSYPLMISAVGGLILNMADRYLVRFLENLSEMGVYNLGFKIANVLKIVVIQSAFSAINPLRFKIMDKPDNKRFYSKIMTYSVFGFFIVQMVLMYFSKELIVLIAEDQNYWGAIHIIPILCFVQLFEILRRNVNIGLAIQKKTKIISFAMLTSALVNVGLNFILIYFFGAIGAAVATLVSQILFFGIIYYNAQKHYYVPYEMIKIAKMTGLVIILTIIAYLSNNIELIPRLIIKVFLITVFPFLLYLMKFYEPIEIQRISQAWHKWKNPAHWRDNIRQIKIK
jgi:O-antigen/teichoic acid export membrane protein